MFFESQIFGVIIGASTAGLFTALTEVGRNRTDRRRRSQELRQRIHADAISAVYDLRESLIRLFLVTDNPRKPEAQSANKRTGRTQPDYDRDRDDAFAGYDRSGRRLGEMIHLAEAFGTPGAHAALREFAHATGWYVSKYVQTPINGRLDFKDLENVMEYLIAALCEEARTDADAGHGAKRSSATYRDGQPTWLAGLEGQEAFPAARGGGLAAGSDDWAR